MGRTPDVRVRASRGVEMKMPDGEKCLFVEVQRGRLVFLEA